MAKETNETTIDPNVQALLAAQSEQMDRLQAMVESVLKSSANAGGDVTAQLAAVLDKVTGNQADTAKLIADAQRQQVRQSNVLVPMRSVFNPRGDICPDGWVKPKLACRMMVPWLLDDDSLTREEVELLNLLVLCPGKYVIKRADDSKINISVRVEVDETGTTVNKLVMSHDTAFRNEYKSTMPTLVSMCRQILNQAPEEARHAARLVLTMEEEEALIAAGQLSVSV